MGRIKERIKVREILEKMEFFQGQRAVRELWNEKPQNVQEEDLDNFNRDIRTIRDYIYDLEHELKQYHNLEEQGLLIKLPCKVGDTVYSVENDSIKEFVVSNFVVCMKSIYAYQGHIFIGEIGFSVFATKKEAEKVLEEMRKKVDE